MMNSVRTSIAVFVLFALTSPVGAVQRAYGHQALNQFRLQLGAQTPNGESVYWDDKKIDFTGDPDDFEGAALAVDYRRFVSPLVAVQVSIEGYEADSDQTYIDFVDEFGSPIIHNTNLEQATFGLGVVVFPAGRDHLLIPYVGVGGEIVSWKLTEAGDFIDFGVDPSEVFNDFFFDENDAFGYYLQAGLEFAIGDGWALFAEGRWDRVDDELEGDFIGLGEIDLSSKRISAGIAWAF
jgi:opacity protein-like surface antigen